MTSFFVGDNKPESPGIANYREGADSATLPITVLPPVRFRPYVRIPRGGSAVRASVPVTVDWWTAWTC